MMNIGKGLDIYNKQSAMRIECVKLVITTVRTQKCMVVKVKLTFIGRSDPNHSAFYLCRATSRNPLLCACM